MAPRLKTAAMCHDLRKADKAATTNQTTRPFAIEREARVARTTDVAVQSHALLDRSNVRAQQSSDASAKAIVRKRWIFHPSMKFWSCVPEKHAIQMKPAAQRLAAFPTRTRCIQIKMERTAAIEVCRSTLQTTRNTFRPSKISYSAR